MPNTYYAKVGYAWPEAGLRYAASFIVEYAIYVWFLIGAAVVVAKARNWLNQKARIDWLDVAETALPLTPILFHILYYVFIVGGDHFEYRIFSYLVPLIWISAVKLLAGLLLPPAAISACLAVFIFLSWPIPWVHWSETHNLNTRQETAIMRRPIAGRFPCFARPVVAQWDLWQNWLIEHHVCMRHQEHKVFHEFQTNRYPSRKEGMALDPQGPFPVLVMGSVGVVGWVLPKVSIIDMFGLNDRVVAHRKHRGFRKRHMGHDLRPPPGYTECFEPNVTISPSPRGMPNPPKTAIRVVKRKRPLTPERIRACEDKFFGGW
jgi:arabinofuranosyltransferase